MTDEIENQVQRWAYYENGGLYGPMMSTLDEFNNFLSLHGLVEGSKPSSKIMPAQVNEERDRRIHEGLPYMNHLFEFDNSSKENITGAATSAKFALVLGADPTDLKWHVTDPAEKELAQPFSWITADNTRLEMTAPMVSGLGDIAANWVSIHIFAARNLKDLPEIPADYEDDKYWP